MSVQTHFIKAFSRKLAIKACRAEGTLVSIEALTPKVFKVLQVQGGELLAVVTDLVTGQGSENIFKVEIGLFPR